MSCRNIEVRMYGLDDSISDLIICGRCGDCGAELWETRYRQQDVMHLSKPELHSMTARDVKAHHSSAERHSCRPN